MTTEPGQYGFLFDERRCVQCRTCELACKSTCDVEPGVRWRRLTEEWAGAYPALARTFFSLACMHCATPACAEACAAGAISKRPGDGIVVVDRAKCDGCRDCLAACPYAVPQFGSDGTMQKCDYCLGVGREPACTQSCPADALVYGPLEELRTAAVARATKTLDGTETTGPSIVIVT